jgi:hypothetical protein
VFGVILLLSQSAGAQVLNGGPVVLDLTAGNTAPSFTLQNGTVESICALRLSTVRVGDGSDPDFEGGPVVVRDLVGTDLSWTQAPASGDGVETVAVSAPEMTTPGAGGCIAFVGDVFQLDVVFDSVVAGDQLTVTPLNRRGQAILTVGTYSEGDVPMTVPLPAGEDQVSITFANGTVQMTCDLELEVAGGPDFEGGNVVVREAFDGTDLGWSQSPASGDGVKIVKVEAPELATPGAGGCVQITSIFTVEMSFDAVGPGATLTVVPTNNTGHAILWGGVLTEGGLTIPLTEGLPRAGFTLSVNTMQPVCDLEIDTGGSPDIEGGPVIVKSEPEGLNLQWTQTPASGDGVTQVRAEAPELATPGAGGCMLLGPYSLNITFDAASAGNNVTVLPSSNTGHTVLFGGELTGGTLPVTLTDGLTRPGYGFVNRTTQPICDLLLSTLRLRDGTDPDFEGGPVIVKREPNGEDLLWTQAPASGDGVKEVKVVAPSLAACIQPGELLSVSATFDSATGVDSLAVTPTNLAGQMVLGAGDDGHDGQEQHDLFPGYDGLPGSGAARLVSTNGLAVPVRGIRVTSTDYFIIDVSSPIPGAFDPSSGEFIFDAPVPPGGVIDYTLEITPIPIVDGPPPPFPPTVILVELLVLGEIPVLSPGLLAGFALLMAAVGVLVLRRGRAWRVTS